MQVTALRSTDQPAIEIARGNVCNACGLRQTVTWVAHYYLEAVDRDMQEVGRSNIGIAICKTCLIDALCLMNARDR